MKLKRFVAADIPAAVAAVRRELGRDAVILETRRLPARGWRGLVRRFDRVELVAAVESTPAERRPPRPRAEPVDRAAAGARAETGPDRAPPPPRPSDAAVPPAGSRLDLREGAAPDALREAVFGQDLAPDGTGPPEPIRVQAGLRRLVALVGPTGAGKTTTLAKLAAHLHLEQGWRVALITADTFRVGAVEQLTAYARLLGLPLEVAPTPGALQRALERARSAEVVLIDTSGRGHRDHRGMDDLRAFVRVVREVGAPAAHGKSAGPVEEAIAGGVEVHLVLAASTRRAEATAVLAAHRPFSDRLLLTKLDECESVPDAIGLAAGCGLPLSYCSFGQRVPEDLALAWPDRLAGGLAGPFGGGPGRRSRAASAHRVTGRAPRGGWPMAAGPATVPRTGASGQRPPALRPASRGEPGGRPAPWPVR